MGVPNNKVTLLDIPEQVGQKARGGSAPRGFAPRPLAGVLPSAPASLSPELWGIRLGLREWPALRAPSACWRAFFGAGLALSRTDYDRRIRGVLGGRS